MMIEDKINAFMSLSELPPSGQGALDGLRVGVKDLYDIKGYKTGFGNPTWLETHEVANDHAEMVKRLSQAGAMCVGKTHTDEIAYSLMGVNAHYGTPLNSAAPDCVPGGSSSGSAAATAAGLVDIGLGSDTGGSVRLPASFCGLYGMRTSHARLSLTGARPLAPSFDTVGWFTQTLDVFEKVASAVGLNEKPTPVKNVVLVDDMYSRADKDVRDVLQNFIKHHLPSDVQVSHFHLANEGLDEWRGVFQVHQAYEIWKCHGEWVTVQNPSFGPGVADRFKMASMITQTQAEHAAMRRHEITEHVAKILKAGTVFIVPTSPSTAPLRNADAKSLDDFRTRALEMLCVAGLCRLPQLNLPVGMVDHKPVGLSLIGAHGEDETLIAFAKLLEEVTNGK